MARIFLVFDWKSGRFLGSKQLGHLAGTYCLAGSPGYFVPDTCSEVYQLLRNCFLLCFEMFVHSYLRQLNFDGEIFGTGAYFFLCVTL